MHNLFSSSRVEKLDDFINISDLRTRKPTNGSDLSLHRTSRIEHDAKPKVSVLGASPMLIFASCIFLRNASDLVNNISVLFIIYLKSVYNHPVIDIRNAVLKLTDGIRRVADLESCVLYLKYDINQFNAVNS